MAENSKIEWTHHTFNPWVGCQRVSPGCENCYAEALDKRVGGAVDVDGVKKLRWGPKAPRVRTSAANWKLPLKWNRKALEAGERHRVFCASLADVFEDRPDLYEWRRDLLNLIDATPHLDWLLLTKRPENVRADLFTPYTLDHGIVRQNVWVGATVEDRKHLWRLDELRAIPAVVRFVSFEPLIEDLGRVDLAGIHWAIVGGESGGGARPFDLSWAHSLRAQCNVQSVAFFMKQVGTMPIEPEDDWRARPMQRLLNGSNHRRVPEGFVGLKYTGKGDDIAEFPAELQRREFPEVRR